MHAHPLQTRKQTPPLSLFNSFEHNSQYRQNTDSTPFLAAEAGGDLLRDGAGVLPTGRNIHALDPYRMPSPAAMQRGAAAAQAILDAHAATNNGALKAVWLTAPSLTLSLCLPTTVRNGACSAAL